MDCIQHSQDIVSDVPHSLSNGISQHTSLPFISALQGVCHTSSGQHLKHSPGSQGIMSLLADCAHQDLCRNAMFSASAESSVHSTAEGKGVNVGNVACPIFLEPSWVHITDG